MQDAQTIGIDLPLKVLVWQDDNDRVWLAYNDPRWLAMRHGVSDAQDATLGVMTSMLAAVATEAAA